MRIYKVEVIENGKSIAKVAFVDKEINQKDWPSNVKFIIEQAISNKDKIEVK